MKKYKTGHYETLKAGLFPRMFPQGKNGWVNRKSGRAAEGLQPRTPLNTDVLTMSIIKNQ